MKHYILTTKTQDGNYEYLDRQLFVDYTSNIT